MVVVHVYTKSRWVVGRPVPMYTAARADGCNGIEMLGGLIDAKTEMGVKVLATEDEV